MRFGRTLLGVTAGVVTAVVIGALGAPDAALARRRGGPMRLIDVDVGSFAGVPLNTIIEYKFSQRVRKSTVHHGVFLIREENATGTGFTKQVPGHFQVEGRIVRFFPRLATHLRDPDSPTNAFYPEGDPRDDAEENAGLQPNTNYEIQVLGHPTPSPVRSTKRRKLRRTSVYRFTTAPISPRTLAYTLDTYQDAPPPGFVLSNPPDKVASPFDQYANHGGTVEVPNGIDVTLFGNKVPLNAATVRQGDHVSLMLTERKGDPSLRKPVIGTPFVEQNFDTSKIVFSPRFALPDLGVFALRVKKDVKDLQSSFDYRNNAERLRLRGIWEFLDTARTLSPSTPPAQLQNPPIELIFDWPISAVERGILKANVLALGDTYPDEIDPRVMVLFSTRDEPVSNAQLVFEFVESDGRNDDTLSTASYDELVAGSAAAIMTVAGGSGVNGDYEPVANETINVDTFPNNTINWRSVKIGPGVVVTLEGSRPAIIRALSIEVDGELRADGLPGTAPPNGSNNSSTAQARTIGGLGGPGGGKGGDSSTSFPLGSGTGQATRGAGLTGTVGNDSDDTLASADDGGRGGLGGGVGTGSIYNMGAGGGGGGAKFKGSDGSPNLYSQTSWNGAGGIGGAAALGNDDLSPLVGGAGGGAGGNGGYGSNNWRNRAGSAGGGGGAVRIDTAAVLTVGASGVIRSRGGGGARGNTGSTFSSGAGGGGGGGSLLLRSSKGFNIADPGTATDVRGGPGGRNQQVQTWVSPFAGDGGDGFVRLEDPNGGLLLPGATQGVFDPVGGGVASFIYTEFADIGVDGPRILNFTEDDFALSAINDAILIEAQFAIEDPAIFGSPLLTALDPNDHSSANEDQVSQFVPIRYVDNTGSPTPAIPDIVGYDPGTQGSDVVFDIASAVDGKAYKFVRLRITFQLDDLQSSSSPLPFVDRVALNFQFNF